MENLSINHIAIFVCALSSLVIGFVWWSPILFQRAWQRETGLTDEQLAKAKPLKTFGLAFILSWLMAYNLAFFLGGPDTTWHWGIAAGLLAGAGWAATQFVVIALFEQRSWKYIAINGGYVVVYFLVMGFIIGIWR